MSVRSSTLVVALASLAAIAACSRGSQNQGAASKTDSVATPAPTPGPTVAAGDSASAGAPQLRGTEWRLVALGDKPVTPADSQRAARVILQPDSKQVVGSGGCNRLFGVYELNGDALRFSGVGSTKMACRTGMDTENAFLPALLRVRRWRITGQQLELSDSSGVVLARFDAKPK